MIRLERYLLGLMIIGLPFTALPASITRYMSGKLSTDILILLIFCVLIEIIRGHHVNRKAVVYLVTLSLWGSLCIIYNIIHFDFVEILKSYSIPIVNILHRHISWITLDNLQLLYYGIHSILRFLAHYCFPLSLVYIIWHMYRDKEEKLLPWVEKNVLILACLMEFYSIFELMWLKWGSNVGERFLTYVNPLLYDVASKSGWWPPLLWWNQLRSICAEPSFFGVISALVIPVLWKYQSQKANIIAYCFTLFFTIMVFATNSRTAVIILIGETILLILFGIYLHDRLLWKKIVMTVCSVAVAFVINIGLGYVPFLFAGTTTSELPQTVQNVASEYIDSNIKSVASTSQRSNLTRLDIFKAHIAIIKDTPVFGKGYDTYIPYLEYYSNADLSKDQELNGYVNDIHEKGFLKAGYPVVNEISLAGATMGIPGMILYLFPLMFIFYGMWRYHKQLLIEENVFIIIALFGSIMAMFSTEAFYSMYLCIGVLYTKIWNIRNNI